MTAVAAVNERSLTRRCDGVVVRPEVDSVQGPDVGSGPKQTLRTSAEAGEQTGGGSCLTELTLLVFQ